MALIEVMPRLLMQWTKLTEFKSNFLRHKC